MKGDLTDDVFTAEYPGILPTMNYYCGGCFVSDGFATHIAFQLAPVGIADGIRLLPVRYRLAPGLGFPPPGDVCAAGAELSGNRRTASALVVTDALAAVRRYLALAAAIKTINGGRSGGNATVLIYPRA